MASGRRNGISGQRCGDVVLGLNNRHEIRGGCELFRGS